MDLQDSQQASSASSLPSLGDILGRRRSSASSQGNPSSAKAVATFDGDQASLTQTSARSARDVNTTPSASPSKAVNSVPLPSPASLRPSSSLPSEGAEVGGLKEFRTAAPPLTTSNASSSLLNIPQTISNLHSRYTLRKQASRTFKEMCNKGDEGIAAISSPSRSSSVDERLGTTGQPGSSPPGKEDASSESGPAVPGVRIPPPPPLTPPSSIFEIPESLQSGENMLKVTHKKVMQRVFKIDADRGQIVWASKKGNCINLESIREVRIGPAGASFRTSLNISTAHEMRWISIIYQQVGTYKALHLIALSNDSLERWNDTLEHLRGLRQQVLDGLVGLEHRNDLWLRQHWKGADSSQDEKLSFKEVARLCTRLGMQASRKELMERFQQADRKGRDFLDFDDFQYFVTLLKRRGEVEELFAEWADTTAEPIDHGLSTIPPDQAQSSPLPVISLARFCDFFEQQCGERSPDQRASSDIAASLFLKYSSRRYGGLLYDGFTAYLQSEDNAALKESSPMSASNRMWRKIQQDGEDTQNLDSAPSRCTAETAEELLSANATPTAARQLLIAPQIMDYPLTDYFVSSSHNTYLVGGQWRGDSTVEGYVRALQQGARCVELDCWDGPNGQPQITHGHTLTSKVSFRDVITAIARYAFVKSQYPLILSLEVHNDLAQQTTMAKALREVLGDMLLSERLTCPAGQTVLPSPAQLRGKILVKAKNIHVSQGDYVRDPEDDLETFRHTDQNLTATQSSATETGSESDGGIFASAKGLVRSVTRHSRGESGNSSSGSTGRDRSLSSSSSSSSSARRESRDADKGAVSPELAALLVYTVGVKHRGINKKEHYAPEHMISLSERTAFKYARDRALREDLIKHNRSHLTRTYPSMGSLARLHASANYFPHHLWALGCQLVALNWQTLDLGYALNQSMFARNAGFGYVLKPPALRTKGLLKNTDAKVRCILEVTIISAQQLPRLREADQDRDGLMKEEQDHDQETTNPFVALSLLAPESWGKQPQNLQQQHHLSSNSQKAKNSLCGGHNDFAMEADESTAVQTGVKGQDSGGSGDSPSTSLKTVEGELSASQMDPLKRPSTRPPLARSSSSNAGPRSATFATQIIKGNGFNPVWNCPLRIGIDVPAGEAAVEALTKHEDVSTSAYTLTRGLLDLAFLRFEVCEDPRRASFSASASATSATAGAAGYSPGPGPMASSALKDCALLASYLTSIGGLEMGYRHLPLFDAQLQKYPFSTLFIKSRLYVLGLVNPNG